MMRHDISRLLIACTCVLIPLSVAQAADSSSVRALFADPPRQYSSGPLWVWNDLLTERQIVETMRDLAGQKVRQVFVHPRPGLMTPYLSDDWFRLWKVALKEAEKLDMNVWIYDENSYPSGFAGGFVPDAMPESRGRGLTFREDKLPGKLAEDTLAVYRLAGKGCENVTGQVRAGQKLPTGRYLTVSIRRAGSSPWYGGKYYVDILYPGVTEKFLEVTMEPYKHQIGHEFGKRVPGVFTDEPHLRPAGSHHWTP
ncbi:MAG: glycosyl hydrolase, partial [Planctomycetota bacterium]